VCTTCEQHARQVLLGPLLGFVMNFVPHPVISGFTSAGGLIIAMSQLKVPNLQDLHWKSGRQIGWMNVLFCNPTV